MPAIDLGFEEPVVAAMDEGIDLDAGLVPTVSGHGESLHTGTK